MTHIDTLLENNAAWAARQVKTDPQFFSRLSHQQAPKYLWIGCADSRVPANEIVGLLPGELFVHRNVANLVIHTDLNCLSVIQYAVDILKIEHIIVCGHYGCGGVRAAYSDAKVGLVTNWLRHIQDTMGKHKTLLKGEENIEVAVGRLCELNVIEQVLNVSQTTVVQAAWERQQPLSVHGWIYGLEDGKLKTLTSNIHCNDTLQTSYDVAVGRYAS